MSKLSQQINAELEVLAEGKSTNTAVLTKLKKMDAKKFETFLINFAAYWSLLKLVLKFAKIITGKKGDKIIDDIIAWGDENLS
jgi:hypothetical protein